MRWAFWRKNVTKGKSVISVQVEPEDYERVRQAAEAENISMSQWVRKALFEATTKPAAPIPETIATPDAGARDVVMPPNQPQVPLLEHACQHNYSATPAFFTAGQCEGLCRHPEQYGRICFWASRVSKQCDKYTPRHVRVPSPPSEGTAPNT